MANFTLREPPVMSGEVNRDIEELYAWCRDIYEAFWVNEFYSLQKRRKEENSNEDESS